MLILRRQNFQTSSSFLTQQGSLSTILRNQNFVLSICSCYCWRLLFVILAQNFVSPSSETLMNRYILHFWVILIDAGWKKLILLQKISNTNLAISNNFCRPEEKMSLHRSFMDVISVIEWKSYPRPYTGSSKLPHLNTYQEWNVTNTKQCNNHES